MEDTDLVSKIADNGDKPPTDSTAEEGTSNFSAQEGTSAQPPENFAIGCGPFIREAPHFQGLSQGVVDIILESWKNSTKQQYWTYLQKWIKFCMQRGTDPLLTPVALVLDFLLELFNSGLGYSALNTARGALSSISSKPVGSNVLVTRFMKGIFHKRPSLPRYHVTWDVTIVLDYLKSLPPNEKLTLKILSEKLIMLMALLSGQRGQTLHTIKLSEVKITEQQVIIQIRSLLKTSKPTNHIGLITIPAFPTERRLCIVTVLRAYIVRTQSIRKGEKLFISTILPHHEVSRDTISRWLRHVLQQAGVDTSIFKPHSTRMASTSKAVGLHVPISTIIRTAGWKTDCTFRKFYKTPITNQNDTFALTLLDSVKTTEK